MHAVLPFIVSGLATGAIYGLAGTGLVLTYRTSGLFNFAHGAIATAAAYAFYAMHIRLGLPWVPSLIISVLVVGPAIGTVLERAAARLVVQQTAHKIVGTVGIILLVQSIATIWFGPKTIRVRPFLPRASRTVRVAGVVITYNQIWVAAVAVVAVGGLYVFVRRSRLGTSMRAVVDDPELLAMQGTNPAAVRRIAWIVGATYAALSGVLLTPFVGLDSILLTFLIVQAFGAAALGAFASLPLTFAGGLLIGVLSDISKKYVLNVSWLSGFPDALPFLILFGALLVLPRHRLVPPSAVEAAPKPRYSTPPLARLVFGAPVLLALLLVPVLAGTKLPFFTAGLCGAMFILSLGLLVRTSGQVSLCHASFAAIGAVAFSQIHVEHGLPWVPALLLAGLVVVPVGALVAVPAIRLSGLFLALATLGFGILVQRLAYGQSWMFTTLAQGRPMPRPGFAASTKSFYYAVLFVVVLTSLGVTIVKRARLGRLLRGMSGSPTAVTSMGLSTNVSKLIVFCLSAYVAGVAGALLGVSRGYAIGGDPYFQPFFSLVLLAMLTVAPFDEPWYGLVPAIAAVVPAFLHGASGTYWLNAAFGAVAVRVAMRGGQDPVPEPVQRFLDRFARPRRPRPATPLMTTDPTRAPVSKPSGGVPGLAVHGLHVSFGGLVAVDGVEVEAPPGRVTGLIGPNGAGKTSTFDAVSGINRRYEGSIVLHGGLIDHLSTAGRARRGIGRTFQRMELCTTLDVLENVALGAECAYAGARPLAHLAARPTHRAKVLAAAWDAVETCGLADLATAAVGTLSTGHRRLVELARCLAGTFDVLLLDEPSSGLDPRETALFAALLRRIVAERGVAVLLVEHDMGLIMEVCDHVYVLDFGRLIFEGTPAEVASSDLVKSAYLGVADPGALRRTQSVTSA